MGGLFDDIESAKRQRLIDLGWSQAPVRLGRSAADWIRPDGARVTEDEAFRQLDALEVLESDREVE